MLGSKLFLIDFGSFVNDEIIESWDEWVEIIRRSPNQQLNIDILRNETIKNIALVPENILENGKNIGRIGVRPEITDDLYESYFALEQYSLHLAILKAFDKTWEMSVLTLKVLGKIIIGDASVKNLSGPISIAKYAGQSASIGFTALLTFLAIVSISLGVLNLLPIRFNANNRATNRNSFAFKFDEHCTL